MQSLLSRLPIIAASAAILSAVACSETRNEDTAAPAEASSSAADKQGDTPMPPASDPDWPASCDKAAGARALVQCKVCHSMGEGAANLTGPNLFGVYGRSAAALNGFAYSPTMRKSGLIWDENTLDGFLENPPRYLTGNRMAFGGVRNDEARAALICYLKALK